MIKVYNISNEESLLKYQGPYRHFMTNKNSGLWEQNITVEKPEKKTEKIIKGKPDNCCVRISINPMKVNTD